MGSSGAHIQPPFTVFSVLLAQVIGPHEVAANTGELLGRARAEARLLSWGGWRCVYLPAAALSGPEDVQLQRVAAMLEKEGVSTGYQQDAVPLDTAASTGMRQLALGMDTIAVSPVSPSGGSSVVQASAVVTSMPPSPAMMTS